MQHIFFLLLTIHTLASCISKEKEPFKEWDLLLIEEDEQEPAFVLASTCRYDGLTYRVGQKFSAKDGCNSCACDHGEKVICTLKKCKKRHSRLKLRKAGQKKH